MADDVYTERTSGRADVADDVYTERTGKRADGR